jgi:fission 1 protein
MSTTEVPYAADAEVSLNYDELEVSRQLLSIASLTYLLQVLRIQYQKELAQNHVTIQTKFNYSWGLVKSPVRDHQVEGVRLLQGVYISH